MALFINKIHLIFIILCNFMNQGLFFILILDLHFLSENNSHHNIIGKSHIVFCNQLQFTAIHPVTGSLDLALIIEKV